MSVAVQERNGRRYAAERWPDLTAEAFVDNDISAANPDVVRPGYQRMLDAIRTGAVVHVVTREQSRLTRQPAEWEQLCITLTRAGIAEVHTTTGGIVSVGKSSRLAGRLIAVVDAEEAERASVRIKVAAQAAAEDGKPSGSTCYGYRRATDDRGVPTLAPHPEQAPVVQRIVAELADGRSAGAIAMDLMAERVPTPRGAPRWHRESIRAVATSPRIVGDRVHQGKVIGPGNWPALVDRSTWVRALAQLQSPVVRRGDGALVHATRVPSRPRRRLLSGIALCTECGTPLIAGRQFRRHLGHVLAYDCPHPSRTRGGCGKVSVTAEYVDGEVIARLRAAAAAGIITSPAQPDRSGHAHATARVADAEHRLGVLAQEWGAGEISEFEWRAGRKAAAALLEQARAELAGFDVPADIGDPVELIARWDDLELGERRRLLASVATRIAVSPRGPIGRRWDPDRVTVEWRT